MVAKNGAWHGLLILLTALAGVVAGCGSDAERDTSSSTSDAATSSASVGAGGAGGATVGAGGGGASATSGVGGAPSQIGPAGDFALQLTVDGIGRSYQLHVPQSAVDAMAMGPVPMLFAMHGAGDEGANFIAATGLTSTADNNGFVVVGPNGYNNGWFVQGNEGWTGADGHDSSLQNDAQLMLDIIAETALSYYLDPSRLYAVGHSRGAGFTSLLAMTSGQMPIASGIFSSPFSGYVINAGYDPTQGAVDAAAASPKQPIWVIHGSADGVVPPSYGQALYDSLAGAGWDATWTSVPGGPHTWLFQSTPNNQDLWNFLAN